jgi:hypothetical protein
VFKDWIRKNSETGSSTALLFLVREVLQEVADESEGNAWEYGNGEGESVRVAKNKRTAIREHHVNETKETGRGGIHKIN